jgi:hypothetical protein
LVANRIEGTGTLSAATAIQPGRRRPAENPHRGVRRQSVDPVDTGERLGTTARRVAAEPGPDSLFDIVTIDGQPVPQPPSGSTSNPDVVFNRSGTVFINVETTNIPAGTMVNVRVVSGNVMNIASAPTDRRCRERDGRRQRSGGRGNGAGVRGLRAGELEMED